MTNGTEKFTRSLRLAMFRTSFIPIVVEVVPGTEMELANRALFPVDLSPRQIVSSLPGLSFVSTRAPLDVVDQLSQLDIVKSISHDAPVGFFIGERVSALLDAFRVNGVTPRQVIMGRRLARTTPAERGWIGTADSRKAIGADTAFGEGFTGKNTTVAVIDTGVSSFHRAFRARGVQAYSVHRGNRIGDTSGHGTWCCATVGGNEMEAENGLKMMGVSEAKLISIKALETPIGTGRSSDIIKAMELAYQLKAKIVSMSLGGPAADPEVSDPECKTVKKLTEAGMIFAVAAGNDGPDAKTIGTPGICSQAITIGAYSLTDGGQVSSFSSRGPTPVDGLTKPCVCAPGGGRALDTSKPRESLYGPTSVGGSLDSTDHLRSGFATIAGTSMATPHVAGMFAIWNDFFLSKVGREISRADIAAIFQKNGHAPTNNDGYGNIQYNWVKNR